MSWWRRYRAAASVAAIVTLAASAALIYKVATAPAPGAVTAPVEQPAVIEAKAVRVINFEDTPLTQVIAEIEETYRVKISGKPDNADNLHLSLHYEGNAADLVETINEILGTRLTVEDK